MKNNLGYRNIEIVKYYRPVADAPIADAVIVQAQNIDREEEKRLAKVQEDEKGKSPSTTETTHKIN